jgi:peptidyl-tRNA hydrolase, PTH1 family
MEKSLLFVGLGNPGKEYEITRHNLGFLIVEKLAEEFGASLSMQAKFEAKVAESNLAGKKIYFLLPQTYMNESGRAVARFLHFYKLSYKSVVVVVDDMDLPFGALRLKEKGGSGGHNGLKSIQACLGTQEYMRLKAGIGRGLDPAHHHVLGRFNEEELKQLPQVINQAVDYLKRLVEEDFHKVANDSNRKVVSSRGE